jgi:hypothetical protein
VTLTQGLASIPASLVMLTCTVAYRLAGIPSAAASGIASKSVGGVSWSMGSLPGGIATDDLTDREKSKLRKIVPVQTVQVIRA